MIATHNIKVDGVWYVAGEEIKEVSSPVIETKPSDEFEELFGSAEVVEEKKTTKKSTKK